jgi:hypothetical protein
VILILGKNKENSVRPEWVNKWPNSMLDGDGDGDGDGQREHFVFYCILI